MAKDNGIVNIHGKDYHTVAKRVQDFRADFDGYSLTTELVQNDGNIVVMKAMIGDKDGRTVATGYAEEDRSKGQINRTSALENAETSAIGRALAALGIGGTEFASANEVQNAVHQQQPKREKWDTPIPNKTALHKALTSIEAEFRGMRESGDIDQFEAFLTTKAYKDFTETALVHAPHYLEGGEPAPPEFIGIYQQEQELRDILEQKEAA